MTKYIFIFLVTISAYGQITIEMETPKNSNENFTEFITEKKFIEQPYPNFYSGISDKKMQTVLTERINLIALDFKNVSESKKPTDKKYQEKLGIGLTRFSDIYWQLDTGDQEQICSYIERIMDIVELQSSNGQLNKFVYGFEPNEYKKEK